MDSEKILAGEKLEKGRAVTIKNGKAYHYEKTNEEILKAAIEKAIDNNPNFMPEYIGEHWTSSDAIFQLFGNKYFAKAFWGDNDLYKEDEDRLSKKLNMSVIRQKVWQYHLQQMVLEEDPIKYLEQFIR